MRYGVLTSGTPPSDLASDGNLLEALRFKCVENAESVFCVGWTERTTSLDRYAICATVVLLSVLVSRLCQPFAVVVVVASIDSGRPRVRFNPGVSHLGITNLLPQRFSIV